MAAHKPNERKGMLGGGMGMKRKQANKGRMMYNKGTPKKQNMRAMYNNGALVQKPN